MRLSEVVGDFKPVISRPNRAVPSKPFNAFT
jgi:hypothetical protein